MHLKQRDDRRGTAHARGYTFGTWQPFRRRFIAALVEHGIVPVCGAALPSGPSTDGSACQTAGLLTFASADGSSLHLDHEPPLQDWERRIPSIVCDPLRVRLLCKACHSARTASETQVNR